MNLTPASKTIAAAIALCISNCASAAPVIEIYGNLDAAVDHTHQAHGNNTGTALAGSPSPVVAVNRVTTSLLSQSFLGLRGEYDIGQGYKAGVVLESLINVDTGNVANDGRIFGRQADAWVQTPWGRVTLGRQYAPIFYAFARTTTGYLGTTDVMIGAITVNNLQIWQDNQFSIKERVGDFNVVAAWSPNAGVGSSISAARGSQVTPTSGQILGGQNAGSESPNRAGESYGAALSYDGPDIDIAMGYHYNKFNVPIGLYSQAKGTFTKLFDLQSFSAVLLAAKYKFAGTGTDIAGTVYRGGYDAIGPIDPKIQAMSIGLRQTHGQFSANLQYIDVRFTNFTKGRDDAAMLTLEYSPFKSTTIYALGGFANDHRGSPTPTATGLPVAGGPNALLVPVGALEVPLFSGAGINNVGARTEIAAIGIRQQF